MKKFGTLTLTVIAIASLGLPFPALAANYRAEPGAAVSLALGDRVQYALSNRRHLSIAFRACDVVTGKGTFDLVKRVRGGRQEGSIEIDASDSGFDVEVIKLSCTSVSVGGGQTATSGRALITAPVSVSVRAN